MRLLVVEDDFALSEVLVHSLRQVGYTVESIDDGMAADALLRHERFDLYVRRQEALNEEERRLMVDDPYTWGDHLRWYLQTPRREYRG